MTKVEMSEAQARDLVRELAEAGLRCWLMGGWGVDALLGRQTRSHHDLDMVVDADDLPALHTWLRGRGFTRSYEWDENASVTIGGRAWDTAFVEHHADGRELDLHAAHVERGSVRLATTDPWELPDDALTGTGRIGGLESRCVSVAAQRAMHVGYDLPDTHLADLRQLDSLDSGEAGGRVGRALAGGAVITTGLTSLELEPAHPDIYDRPIGLRLLFQDPHSGAEHYLVRYPEGLQARRHTHTAAHTIVVLEGAMVADGQHVGPGSYLHHPSGVEMHHTAAPEEHCLFVIVFDGPFDVRSIPNSDDVGRRGGT